jgi:hypothetical protein
LYSDLGGFRKTLHKEGIKDGHSTKQVTRVLVDGCFDHDFGDFG